MRSHIFLTGWQCSVVWDRQYMKSSADVFTSLPTSVLSNPVNLILVLTKE